MAEAPTPTTSEPKPQTKFKVADLGNDGEAFLKLDDGRHVFATIKPGVEVKRGDTVETTNAGLDKEGAPKDVVIVRVLS